MVHAQPQLWGPVVLLKRLATGGMGRIDLALTGEHDLVVLKRISTDLAVDDLSSRFRREAALACQFDHPNLVATLDHGTHDAQLFLIQEYLRGPNLETLLTQLSLQRERMPVDVAVAIALQVLAGLRYVHTFRDLGIVHRDVAAPNVMVTHKGAVKLIDFGTAKPTETSAENLTLNGRTVGRDLYTPLDVLRGARPHPSDDLYALCVLLWHLLTGLHPAEHYRPRARTGSAPLPRVTRFVAHVPSGLDSLIRTGLSATREARHRSAQTLYTELSEFVSEPWDAYAQKVAALVATYTPDAVTAPDPSLVDAARALLREQAFSEALTVDIAPARNRIHRGLLAATVVFVFGAGGFLLCARKEPSRPESRQLPPSPVKAQPVSELTSTPQTPPVKPAHTPEAPPSPEPPPPVPAAHARNEWPVRRAPKPRPAKPKPRKAPQAKQSTPLTSTTTAPVPPKPLDLDAGWAAFRAGDVTSAELIARETLTLNDANTQARRLLAQVFLRQRKFLKAGNELRRLLDNDPTNAALKRLLDLAQQEMSQQ